MKPWGLISCYASEKRKREEKLTTEQYKGKAIMDTDVKSVKSEKSDKKYQGAKVPYRNQ